MKWIKRAVLGIFLAAAAVIGVLGFTKYQARQAESKMQQRKHPERKNRLKKLYDRVSGGSKKRLETAKESGTYTTEKMLVEQNPFGTNTLSLYVYFATEEPVSVSYVVSVPDSEIADFGGKVNQEETYTTEHEFQVIGLIPDMEKYDHLYAGSRRRNHNHCFLQIQNGKSCRRRRGTAEADSRSDRCKQPDFASGFRLVCHPWK